MTTPVTNDAPALHSQTTAPATSSGSPKRPARRGRDDPLPALGQLARLVEQERTVLLGDEEPRRNGVYADVRCELDGEPAGEILDGSLRRPVADDPRERAVRRERRDVDDRPAAQLVAEDLAREQRAVKVEPDDFFDRSRIELEERPLTDRGGGDVAARGVDEDVDAPEALQHRRAGGRQLPGVEHVGLEHHGGVAEARRQHFERRAAPCQQGDARARRSEPPRDRTAEHARGARHKRDPLLEAEQLGETVDHGRESLRPG